jgi:nitrate reductase NapAB chaperone NapD
MTILGAIMRTAPEHVAALADQLARQPGVDVAMNPGDGRLILVIEDSADSTAAATLAAIALLDPVINTSLVYEHSGSDGEPADPIAGIDATSWRASLHDMARGVDLPGVRPGS